MLPELFKLWPERLRQPVVGLLAVLILLPVVVALAASLVWLVLVVVAARVLSLYVMNRRHRW